MKEGEGKAEFEGGGGRIAEIGGEAIGEERERGQEVRDKRKK